MFASCLNFQVLIKSLNFLKRTAKYFLANLENNSSLQNIAVRDVFPYNHRQLSVFLIFFSLKKYTFVPVPGKLNLFCIRILIFLANCSVVSRSMLCSSTKFVGTKYQNLVNIEVNVGGILQEVYSSNNSFADLLSFARRFFYLL